MITARNDFGQDMIDYDQPHPDPIALLMMWLPPHIDAYRPLMSLATLDQQGFPDLRHVLLSSYDQQGVAFHVDRNSRKVAQLEVNANVAASIVWPEQARQLIIQGQVERIDQDVADAVYLERNRYLQLLAWLNDFENSQLPLRQRQQRWQAFSNAHPEGELQAPPCWTGYRIKAQRIGFWRGQADSSSLRHDYQLINGTWQVQVLPG